MKRAARVISLMTGMQYIVLQNADAEPRTLFYLIGSRGGIRRKQPWFTKLIAGGYLEQVPAVPCKPYVLYRRTDLGAELAAQLGVMADRLGWEPG